MQENEQLVDEKSHNLDIKLSDGDAVAAKKLIYSEINKDCHKNKQARLVGLMLISLLVAIIIITIILL